MGGSKGIHVSSEMREKIRKLYAVVGELEKMFPGRHFTPDGHTVGSIGEVIAADEYGLKLFEASYPVHDAVASDGKLVQIKATQGTKIAINECLEHLIALKLYADGSFDELYNGPGRPAWDIAGNLQKTGQKFISASKLKDLMREMSPSLRLPGKSDAVANPSNSDEQIESEIARINHNVEIRERMLPKFEGCLIGGAAGDALGYVVEFMSWDEIRTRYGEEGIRSYEPDEQTGLALVSDDTQVISPPHPSLPPSGRSRERKRKDTERGFWRKRRSGVSVNRAANGCVQMRYWRGSTARIIEEGDAVEFRIGAALPHLLDVHVAAVGEVEGAVTMQALGETSISLKVMQKPFILPGTDFCSKPVAFQLSGDCTGCLPLEARFPPDNCVKCNYEVKT